MATGLTRWTLIVAGACAVLAIVALPPSVPEVGLGQVRADATPERIRALELREEVRVAQEALRRRRWIDSLTALTLGVAERPERVFVDAPVDSLREQQIREGIARLADDARAELDRLGVARPAVDLGVFLLARGSGLEGAVVGVGGPLGLEWYAGERDGRGYCIAARIIPGFARSNVRGRTWVAGFGQPETNIFGPCGWFARYGLPGAATHDWLRGPGAGLALARGPRPVDAYPVPEWNWLRLRWNLNEGDLRIEACLKRADDCDLLLTQEVGPAWSEGLEALENRLVDEGVPLLESSFDFSSWGAAAYILIHPRRPRARVRAGRIRTVLAGDRPPPGRVRGSVRRHA